MFHRWAALLSVLALCAMTPKNAAGQTQAQQPRGQKAEGKFGKPYPNPFNPEIRIPFSVDTTGGCRDGSRQRTVTVGISNILSQEVAIPVLEGVPNSSTTSVPTSLLGAPLSNVRLGCGDYLAYWSGFVKNTKREAASGTYLVRIFVDGELTHTIRILNRK
jgi:hypothetical protein